MAGEHAPGGSGGGEIVSDALRIAREELKARLSQGGGEEFFKNLGYDGLTEDQIDTFSEDQANDLLQKAKEYEADSHEKMIKDTTDRLMGMSFATYFAVIKDFMASHPGCKPLGGFSRAHIEQFVRDNMATPGDMTIFQFEESMTNSQQALDNLNTNPDADVSGMPLPPPPDPISPPVEPVPINSGDMSGDASHESGEIEKAKEQAVEDIANALFAPIAGSSEERLVVDEGVFIGEGEMDKEAAKAKLKSLLDGASSTFDVESAKISIKHDLRQRQISIDRVVEQSMANQFQEAIQNTIKETGIDNYREASTPDLETFSTKFKEVLEKLETKKQNRKRGRTVAGSCTKFGLAAAAAITAIATLVLTITGSSQRRAALPAGEGIAATDSADEGEDTPDIIDLTAKTVDEDNEESAEQSVEQNEAEEGDWDALHGNDARGLWANEDGTGPNENKKGERNLVGANEFAGFTEERLSTDEGQKEFKDHFMSVATREAAVLEQVADYAQKHGDLELLPPSIRNLEGEELENAINENRDGCYDELLSNLKNRLENAHVKRGNLEAGNYSNYYAHMINPDGMATKDNLELETCTTWENGTDVFIVEFGDGSYLMFKEGCIQLVERIPDRGTPPPEKETPPPDEETPPPDDETPPPDEETPPPDDETPPPDDETPPPDNSKHEEALKAGQGDNVSPVQEGERIERDRDQVNWTSDGIVVEPISQEAENADQTLNQINYADDIAAQEAQRRQEAAEEQARIDEAAASQEAVNLDLNELGNGF